MRDNFHHLEVNITLKPVYSIFFIFDFNFNIDTMKIKKLFILLWFAVSSLNNNVNAQELLNVKSRDFKHENSEYFDDLVYAGENMMYFYSSTVGGSHTTKIWGITGITEMDYTFQIKNRVDIIPVFKASQAPVYSEIKRPQVVGLSFYDKTSNRILFLTETYSKPFDVNAQWLTLNPLKQQGNQTLISSGKESSKMILSPDSSHFALIRSPFLYKLKDEFTFTCEIFDMTLKKVSESTYTVPKGGGDLHQDANKWILLNDLSVFAVISKGDNGIKVVHLKEGKVLNEVAIPIAETEILTSKLLFDSTSNKMIIGFLTYSNSLFQYGYGLVKYDLNAGKAEPVIINKFNPEFIKDLSKAMYYDGWPKKTGISVRWKITDLQQIKNGEFFATFEIVERGMSDYMVHDSNNDCLVAIMNKDGKEIHLKHFLQHMTFDRFIDPPFGFQAANKIVYSDKVVFFHFLDEKLVKKHYPEIIQNEKTSSDNYRLLATTVTFDGKISTKSMKQFEDMDIVWDGNMVTPLTNDKFLFKYYDKKYPRYVHRMGMIQK